MKVWFYYFIKFFVVLYIRFMYKIKFIGLENVPKDKGFIMASNHVYAFDPIFLAMGTKRTVRYLAKAELFQSKHWGWFFKWAGCICVERGKGDLDVMGECAKVIEDGGILGIFPEGTRSRGKGFLRPKSGMSVIAKMSKADILPICIDAPENIKWRDEITVSFGELIPFESLEIEVDQPRTLKAATRKVWDAVTSMSVREEKISEE